MKTLKIYLIASLLGLLTGLISSYFQLAILGLNHLLASIIAYSANHKALAGLSSAILSMSLALLSWWLVKRFAPEASGSGVPEIKGKLLHKRAIYWRRLLPVKFIAGTMAIAAKLVVGREGPTIQMGGNLGEMLGEFFKIKSRRRDTLIAAGSAAGLAAAFNAPLAGVLFVIEEMRNEFNFNFTNFKMVAISCAMATIMARFILGDGAAIPMSIFATPSLQSLWLFFLFGIIAGFVGLFFNQALIYSLSMTDRLTVRKRIIYIAIMGALAGFLAVYHPELVGGGYDIIEKSLSIPPDLTILIILLSLRFIATMFCYASGVPGGIFAPMMALGTLLGLACFHALDLILPDASLHPGMFAVVGMGALFSASIRSPLTGIILVVEMTQNYSLILPLLASCLTSTTVVQLAKNKPIYTQLLLRTLRREKLLSKG